MEFTILILIAAGRFVHMVFHVVVIGNELIQWIAIYENNAGVFVGEIETA